MIITNFIFAFLYAGTNNYNSQVRDVVGVTSMVAGVAPQRNPVERARVTVTVLGTEATMTVMRAVRRVWCVGPTTARSLAPTTMRRTTAASDPAVALGLSGDPGAPGHHAATYISRWGGGAGKPGLGGVGERDAAPARTFRRGIAESRAVVALEE